MSLGAAHKICCAICGLDLRFISMAFLFTPGYVALSRSACEVHWSCCCSDAASGAAFVHPWPGPAAVRSNRKRRSAQHVSCMEAQFAKAWPQAPLTVT